MQYLPNPNIPIGTSAHMSNLETFKLVDHFFFGDDALLSKECFGEDGSNEALVGRVLNKKQKKQVLCVISEVFHMNFLTKHLH
jgi:chorismate-pyruvate lyase